MNDASDSKSDNSGSNWTENLAYCAPKRKVKVNVTIQESPRTVRRKKYKINVQSADNENMPDNVPKTVPNNVPKTVPDNVPKTVPENVQKGGGRETGVKQRYHNSQLTLYTRPKLTKDLK